MWKPIIAALGLAAGGVAILWRDVRINQQKEQELEAERQRQLYKLKEAKGRLVTVVNDMNDVLLEGRVHRVDQEEAIIDTRSPMSRENEPLVWPTQPGSHRDLKVWVPKPGHRVIFLDEATA